jgi:hypothetical protein
VFYFATIFFFYNTEAQRYHDHAITTRNAIKFLRQNPEIDLTDYDGGVDMLRLERLNSLDPKTRDRVSEGREKERRKERESFSMLSTISTDS